MNMSEDAHNKNWYVAQVVMLTADNHKMRTELEAFKRPTIGQAVKMLVKAVKGWWSV